MPPSSLLAHVKHILLTLEKTWSESGNKHVFGCARLLEDARDHGLDEVFETKSADMVASPKGLCLEGCDADDK